MSLQNCKRNVDRSKIFFPAKTYNGKNGFFIASLLTDNHNNQYLLMKAGLSILLIILKSSDIISGNWDIQNPTEKVYPKQLSKTILFFALLEIQNIFKVNKNFY